MRHKIPIVINNEKGTNPIVVGYKDPPSIEEIQVSHLKELIHELKILNINLSSIEISLRYGKM